jgi:hypothetical protein
LVTFHAFMPPSQLLGGFLCAKPILELFTRAGTMPAASGMPPPVYEQ